jgi:hypothetical protein
MTLDLTVHSTRQERIDEAVKRLGARLEQALRGEVRTFGSVGES